MRQRRLGQLQGAFVMACFAAILSCLQYMDSSGTMIADAQAPAPPVVKKSVNSEIAWGAPQVNEDGTQLIDLQGYLVAVAGSNIDLRQPNTNPIRSIKYEGETLPQCPDGDCVVRAGRLFAGLPENGEQYHVFVQAYDDAGNVSRWSNPTNTFAIDHGVPMPAQNVEVRTRFVQEHEFSTTISGDTGAPIGPPPPTRR